MLWRGTQAPQSRNLVTATHKTHPDIAMQRAWGSPLPCCSHMSSRLLPPSSLGTARGWGAAPASSFMPTALSLVPWHLSWGRLCERLGPRASHPAWGYESSPEGVWCLPVEDRRVATLGSPAAPLRLLQALCSRRRWVLLSVTSPLIARPLLVTSCLEATDSLVARDGAGLHGSSSVCDCVCAITTCAGCATCVRVEVCKRVCGCKCGCVWLGVSVCDGCVCLCVVGASL